MKLLKLSIIIPVFNESRTIKIILDKIKKTEITETIEKEIIIVNDFSTDETEKVIFDYINEQQDLNINYIKHEKNKGKGASIHTGIAKSTGDFILIQDADLEYNPEDYNDLLKPVLSGFADVVYGNRFDGGKPHRILFFWHSIGNKILTTISNAFTNLNLSDMETCYKLFKADIIKNIRLKEKRFGFEPEVTAKIAKIKNIRIYEVGIAYYGRTYDEGKKINWKDGLKALWCVFKYNLFN